MAVTAIHSPVIDIHDECVPIENGGTGSRTKEGAVEALGIVDSSVVGVENGIVLLGADGKVDPNTIPSSVASTAIPLLYGPTEVNAGGSIVVVITNYDSYTTYTLDTTGASDITVTKVADKITLTANTSAMGAKYFKLNGRQYDFNVSFAVPNKPILNNYTFGDLANGYRTLTDQLYPELISFETNAFSDPTNNLVHAYTTWQLSVDANFASVIMSSNDPANMMTWRVSGLGEQSTYYIRFKHVATNNAASNWSDTYKFVTQDIAAVIYKPVIISPVNNQGNVANDAIAEASSFSTISMNGAYAVLSQWQIATDAQFTSIIKNENVTTGNLSNYTLNGLSFSTQYYMRMRYQASMNADNGSNYSDWSDTVYFTILSNPLVIAAPEIIDIYLSDPDYSYTTIVDGGSRVFYDLTWTADLQITAPEMGYREVSPVDQFTNRNLTLELQLGDASKFTIVSFKVDPTPAVNYSSVKFTPQQGWSASIANSPDYSNDDVFLVKVTATRSTSTTCWGDSCNTSAPEFTWPLTKGIRARWRETYNGYDIVGDWSPFRIESKDVKVSQYTSYPSDYVTINVGPDGSASTNSLNYLEHIYIERPIISTPVDLAINQETALTLTASKFIAAGHAVSSPVARWQVATDVRFSTVVYDQSLAAPVSPKGLRLRSSAKASLERTWGTPTNVNCWTLSLKIKRSSTLGIQHILHSQKGTASGDGWGYLKFLADGSLEFADSYVGSGSNYEDRFITTNKFNSLNDAYHIVLAIDFSKSTVAERIKIIVDNDVQAGTYTGTLNTNATVQYSAINCAGYAAAIGCSETLNSEYLDAILNDIYFIDGLSLPATEFGEYSPVTGKWVSKPYQGVYGNNGFKLTFSNNSSIVNLGLDSSGRGNNWTPYNVSLNSATFYDSSSESDSFLSTQLSNLGYSTVYYARVKYSDSVDSSPWSPVVKFTTKPMPYSISVPTFSHFSVNAKTDGTYESKLGVQPALPTSNYKTYSLSDLVSGSLYLEGEFGYSNNRQILTIRIGEAVTADQIQYNITDIKSGTSLFYGILKSLVANTAVAWPIGPGARFRFREVYNGVTVYSPWTDYIVEIH